MTQLPSKQVRCKKWLPAIVGCTVTACILLVSVFYARDAMDKSLKRSLQSIATIGALSVEPSDVESVLRTRSMQSTQFKNLVELLNAIRDNSTFEIRYAYILRKTDDPLILEFVADADALSSDEQLDIDGSGEVDPTEEASYLGDEYDISENPALQGPAFVEPTTDEEFTIDQWGTLISGYAPIRNNDGETIAVLGVDMKAKVYRDRLSAVAPPLFLLTVVGVALAAFVSLTLVHERRKQAMLG